MGIEQLIIIALIVFGASMVQSMIGFAFNLIAIPMLIWNGLSLAEAVVLTAIPIFAQLSLSVWKLRAHVIWRDLTLPVIIRFVTLPIGIVLLYYLDGLDTATVKQLVGFVLLIIILSELFIHFKPREHFHKFWDVMAFGLSGLLLGMTGMGGPPVAVWLMAHDWEAMRSRAFVSMLFLISSPVQIALLYWRFGDKVEDSFLWGGTLVPVAVLGALLGIKIGNTFDKHRLKNAVIGFLFLASILSIVSPYL